MNTVASLPHDVRNIVAKEFQGERVQWVGQPSPARAFVAALPIWIFSLPWTVFSIGWVYYAYQAWLATKPAFGAMNVFRGNVFPLFGVPFVLGGLYMLSMPFWAWIKARKTVYIVSDRRFACMIIDRKLFVNSYALAGILSTKRLEHADGSGTLTIVTGITRDSDGDRRERTETLYGIADVRKVERLLASFTEKNRAV